MFENHGQRRSKRNCPSKVACVMIAPNHLRVACATLLLLLLAHPSTGQDDFFFSKWPKIPSGPVRSGQGVRFECQVSSDDRISLSWTLNGELVLNQSRRYQDSATGSLIIRRADHRFDSGDFACTATNVSSGFSIVSQSASLSVLWIGNATRISGERISEPVGSLQEWATAVEAGQDVALYCAAEGSADLAYDWFHNGRKIAKTEKRSGRLVLTAVTSNESGTYSCTAKNSAGSTKYNEPFVVSVVSSSSPSRLVHFTKESVALPESSVRLPCSFQPPVDVEWFFRGIPLSKSPNHTVEPDGQLIISRFSQPDEGWYYCRSRGAGEFASQLKVAYINDFGPAPIDPPTHPANGRHYFAEYSTAELTCFAPEGLPPPAVWWEGSNGRLLTTPANSTESVLVLNRLLEKDAGTYQCWAENSAGKLAVSAQLTVTVAPYIQLHPVSISVGEDDPTILTCSFFGSPAPASDVRWFKDGQPFLSADGSTSLQGFTGMRNDASLRFSPTAKRHAGSYACQVTTIGSQPVMSHQAYVIVREKLKFTLPPRGQQLRLGTVTRVHCRAEGSPPPLVRWIKEDQDPLLNWDEHIEDVNGTLNFYGVRSSDAGNYTCVATNSQGLINATVSFDVVVVPHFTSLPQNVTIGKEGRSIEFHCRAEGYPTPSIQWDKDSVMNDFSSNRFKVYSNGTLKISNVQLEDEGSYGCTAGNAGGFKRAEFRLIVQGWEYSSEHDPENFTKTLVITLGAAAAYICLSLGLLIWCRLRRRQMKLRSPVVPTEPPSTALLSKEGQAEAGLYQPVDRLHVPPSNITKGQLVGRGRFGDVLEGSVVGIDGASRVLLRSLATRDEELIVEFGRQVNMLHRVQHPNLVAVLGYCRDSSEVHQLVLMDYQEKMLNLKTHLLGAQQPWTAVQISQATVQIARAMNALSSARFVHRDLGTRNILVSFHGKDNQVNLKVGSFGLDKEPFSGDYFVYKHQPIALRWLPHEAVLEDEYSTKSDVWMFAVCLWELYHGAKQPLANRSDQILLAELTSRASMLWDATAFCKSNALASLLTRCWSHEPTLRPSFEEILQCVEVTKAP